MNRKTFILIVIILFIYGGKSACSKGGFSSKITPQDFEGMTTDKVLTDSDVFKKFYEFATNKVIKEYQLEIQLYKIKDKPEYLYNDYIPKAVFIINGGGNKVKLPSNRFTPLEEIIYILPKNNRPMLCIADPSGGNGWNDNPFYVVSLEESHYLKNLGQVSDVYDIDKDGIDELLIHDDVWEMGLDYLCHAESPGATIIYRVDEGAIVKDVSNHIEYYQKEIDRINEEIKMYPREITGPDKANTGLLSLILEKFLIYKLLGHIEKGWQEFENDIRHYDKDFFFLYGGQMKPVDKVPIQDIKRKMIDSLK